MVNASFWRGRRVIVTGGAGFLGTHLCRFLKENDCDPFVPRSSTYDLRYTEEVSWLFRDYPDPEFIFNLAANVGGIGYNRQHPYSLFYDNIRMGTEIIHQSIPLGIEKFIQVGTVCAYPKWAIPPFVEASLWDGYPEETNAPYGLAKKMLLVQLQAARKEFDFNGIYLLPTNLYGPGDNFNPAQSHVVPALIQKFVEARDNNAESIEVWGTGKASRDFLFVEDAAEAILLAAEKYERDEPLNLGSGQETTIAGLVHIIKGLTGFEGEEKWDTSKPDGQPRRCLNTTAAKQALKWEAKTNLREGLQKTIDWYEENKCRL